MTIKVMKVLPFTAKILLVTLVMTLTSGLLLSEPGYEDAPFIGKIGYLLIMEAWAYLVASTLFAGLISITKSVSAYQVVLLGIAFGVLCSVIYITITLRTEYYEDVIYEFIINGIRYGLVGGAMGLMYVLLFDRKVSLSSSR